MASPARGGPKWTRLLQPSAPGMRIAILTGAAVVLGFTIWGGLDMFSRGAERKAGGRPPVVHVKKVPILVLDRKLLAKIKDATKVQRFALEPEVYEHFLVNATKIVPGTLRAMGLPDEPIPPDTLRRDPSRWRGKPLWYEGEVVLLRPPEEIPGLPGFRKTEGRLKTPEGETILFAVIEPVPPEITLGSYARIEGLFYKLRDENFPEKVERAPFLVGAELRRAFPRFPPVKKLDPRVLAEVRDASDEDAMRIEQRPFYHLASYVMTRGEDPDWISTLPELEREHAVSMVNADGKIARGTYFRIEADLLWVQIEAAEANPLRVDFWTRAWLYHPTVGTIYVVVPGRAGKKDWHTGDPVVVYGAFFKHYRYETPGDPRNPASRFKDVPMFLAADLHPLVVVENPANTRIRLVLSALLTVFVGAMAWLVIKDRKEDQKLRQRLLERRRRRLRPPSAR